MKVARFMGVSFLQKTILASMLLPAMALANASLTYHGRILGHNDQPLEGSSVKFRVRVYSPLPKKCLLYEETRTIDMSGSQGVFVIAIGDRNDIRSGLDPDLAISKVFSNNPLEIPDLVCEGSAVSYTPQALDHRILDVAYDDGSGWDGLPEMALNHVPFSVNAHDAQNIGGVPAASVLKVSGGAAPALSPADFSEFLNLLSGSSTQYEKVGRLKGSIVPTLGNGQVLGWDAGGWSAVTPMTSYKETDPSVSSFAKDALPTCGANSFLKNDGSGNLTCVTVSGASGGTVTSVIAGSGLTGGTITNTGTLAVDGGTGAGQVLQFTTAGQLPVVDGSNVTGVIANGLNTTNSIASGSHTVTGNLSVVNGNIAVSGDGVNNGVVSAPAMGTKNIGVNKIFVRSPADHATNGINITAPLTNVVAPYTLRLPTALPASPMVLSSDAAGNLTWMSPATGSVTSVVADLPLSVDETTVSSPRISLRAGTTTNDVMTWNGTSWISAPLPAGNAGTVTGVTGDSYISVTNGTTTPVLTANIGQVAGTLAAGNDSRFADLDSRLTTAATNIATNATALNTKITAPATCTAGQLLTFNAVADWQCVDVPSSSDKLPLAGGTMTGDLNMGNRNISSVLGIGVGVVSTNTLKFSSTTPTTPEEGAVWYDNGVLKYRDSSSTNVLGVSGAGVQSVTVTSPLAVNNTDPNAPAISIQAASGSQNGYLTSGDWNAFNSKLDSTTTFAGDVSGTSGAVQVDKIKGIPVTPATYANGQVLRYNAGEWVNSLINISTDITGTLSIANGGTGATTRDGALNNLLPTQVGNANKLLQTNGMTVTWVDAPITGITALTGDVTTAAGSGSVMATIPDSTITSAKILDGTINSADMNFAGVNSATSSIVMKDSTGVFHSFACSTTGHVPTWSATGFNCQDPLAVGGLKNFTDSLHTTAPNATVPVAQLMASNIATHVDIALTPKGAGSISAQVADNTAIGGNKRGENAVDFQMARTSATAVASGSRSFLAGGMENTVVGDDSAVIGGGGNTINDIQSAIIGGYGNTTTNVADVIIGGDSNRATGGYSAILGGTNNTAGGGQSLVLGGSRNVASGTNSIAAGYYVNSESLNQVTFGRYNLSKGGENSGNWIATDPLFVVGNGDSSAAKSNALMILKNGNVGVGITSPAYKLDVAGDVNITGNFKINGVNLAAGGGTVTSVSSANTDIAIANPTTTPQLTLNSGTSGGAGDANKIAKLSATGLLAPAMIPNAAGDVTGAYSALTVEKIRGRNIAATAPTADQVLQWDGTASAWTPKALPSAPVTSVAGKTGAVTLSVSDLKTSGNLMQFPTDCSATQTLTWSSGLDRYICTDINVISGAINYVPYYSTATTLSTNSPISVGSSGTIVGVNTTPVSNSGLVVSSSCGGGSGPHDGVYGYPNCTAILARSSGGPTTGVLGEGSGAAGVGVVGYHPGDGMGGYFTSATGIAMATGKGNVGIGRLPSSNTKLDVAGQIVSKSSVVTTNSIDWGKGNAASTSVDCSTAINFANMRDGGAYTLAVTGTGDAMCTFSTATTGDDAGTVAYRFQPANDKRTPGTHTIYSFQRIANTVYVSWISGF
ncbi:hypothetical protein BDW_04090 [Bdellovibrio bacteriovorus W]|nr:hypothetical protein BDW_04090 [Bdellovibrio bacteriovorus W]